ncbi:MAG: hypothetical protein PWR27_1129 [Petroclostridium sp.]|nr:hypothetical protein [Petroclostridium sp.]
MIMEDENIVQKNNVVRNLLWKFMERIGTQVIQFIIQIVLARLLMPEDFGKIAIVTVFINFFNIFTQSSFNFALIQKKNTDSLDYSSVFYLSIFSSFLFYAFIFLGAPLIAKMYDDPSLTFLLKVLGIILIPLSLNSIQIAIISKNMQFKKQFISSLIGIFLSGGISITLAILGYGIWALVVQSIISSFSNMVVLWIIVKWRPEFIFSFHRLRVLFSFGWKILVTNILYNIYRDSRSLIIGKFYSTSNLGYYNKGFQIPAMIINNIDGSIQAVMLPTYSRVQDNKMVIKLLIRKSVRVGAFVIFPIMAGIATTAELFVHLILTDKWLPIVPYIIIFSLSLAFRPINSATQEAITAIGRTDLTLKLSLVNRVVELVILIITASISVYAIAFGTIIASVISTLINLYPNQLLFRYNYKELISDVTPSLINSVVMAYVIFLMNSLMINDLLLFLLQIVVGILSYIIMSWVANKATLNYLLSTFSEIIKKKK